MGLLQAEHAIPLLNSGQMPSPVELLTDPALTETVGDLSVEPRYYESRYDAADELDPIIADAKSLGLDVMRDKGLWTWLALAHTDQLAPTKPNGTREMKAAARWILESDNYLRYYRHLLAGPYYIYQAHIENPRKAMAILATKVEKPGEVVEQLASRQDFVRSPGIIGVATKLYYDEESGSLKRGAAGKDNAGSSRRFVPLVQQLDLTYDLFTLSEERFLNLLPHEFDRFLS